MSATKERTLQNKNYIRLAQVHEILNSFAKKDEQTKALKIVLQDDGDINYQIPANKYFQTIQPDWIGYTALHLAIEKRNLPICKVFIQHGADFTIKNCNQESPLHQAIKCSTHKNIECWNLISEIDHPYADAILSAHVDRDIISNPCNAFGLSHFHIACMTNHTKAVEYFLKNGISVNESIPLDSQILPGFTSLHLAARYCALETAEILLEYGADVHVKDANGMSPMHILILRNIQIADWITMGSCSPYDVFQTEFETNKKIIKLLLEKHTIFSSSTVDDIGLSWLHVACVLQDMSMLQRAVNHNGMLKKVVNSNSPVWPGYTALHFASHFCMDAVKFLLTKGADILAKDVKDITPFDLCLQRYEAEDIHCILQNQSSWKNIQLSDGKTNLVDLILAMRSHNDLKHFLTNSVTNPNVFIPLDSTLWSGYTPLHLSIVFNDRSKDINDLYKNTDYTKDDCTQKFVNCTQVEQDIFLQRIKVCLSLGADVTVKDTCGLTPLHHAFRLGNENVINLLLKKHPKDINHIANDGLSHLHIACAVGNITLVKKILNNGAEVNASVNSRYIFKISLRTDEGTAFYKFTINPGFTPLHIAIAAGNNQLAQLLVNHGANIYAADCDGLTAVHLTMIISQSLSKQCSVVFESIDLLSSANLRDSISNFGLSHLHVACQKKNVNAVKKLLELGVNITETITCNVDETSYLHVFQQTYDGYQPIHFAIENLSREIIELLTQHGADILSKVANNLIPFYEKLFTKDIFDETRFFRSLLARMPSFQQQLTEVTGVTMLHIACEEVNVGTVKKLLDGGANPNAQAHMDSPIWPGWTPLHLALYKCHDDTNKLGKVVKLLLKHGADVNLINAKQNTPLQEAFMGTFMDDYPYTMGLPIDSHRDFSVNPTNAHGISHFHLACFSNNTHAINSFVKEQEERLSQPIDYFSEHYGGYSPLHLAAIHKHKTTIDELLNYGIFDVNARNSNGWTVLHVAASDGYGIEISKEFLETLITESTDPNAQTFYGETALELLLKSNTAAEKTVELFLESGSSVNIFNEITEEGYIGIMVCNNLNGLKSIQKHPFYKGVINAPKRNRVDRMGRTPIHNIVSYHYNTVVPETYAELIEGFVRVGCDINHQDNRGRTALHIASQFENSFGIVALLMNGIDANLLDFEGNSAFTYCLKSNTSESRERYILRNVAKYLQKLQFFGLYVNKLNEDIVKKITKSADNKSDVIKSCQEELKKLKGRKIEPHLICLTDFLSETEIVASYPNLPVKQRQDIDTFFKKHSQQLFKDFPELAGLLLLQYRKALARCA